MKKGRKRWKCEGIDGVVIVFDGWTSVWTNELSSMVEDENGIEEDEKSKKIIWSNSMIELKRR